MSGSTLAAVSSAVVGLTLAVAGAFLAPAEPPTQVIDTAAWTNHVKAENTRWRAGHVYDTRPAGPIYTRRATWYNTPLGGGDPWIPASP